MKEKKKTGRPRKQPTTEQLMLTEIQKVNKRLDEIWSVVIMNRCNCKCNYQYLNTQYANDNLYRCIQCGSQSVSQNSPHICIGSNITG